MHGMEADLKKLVKSKIVAILNLGLGPGKLNRPNET